MSNIVIFDPYDWWPDSKHMFNSSSSYSVLTNHFSKKDRKIKKFTATTKIGKIIEIIFKLPKMLYENRNDKIILMWNVVPVYCYLLITAFRLFGYDITFWMHNSVPHSIAKISRRFVPIIWLWMPMFVPIITMNRKFITFELNVIRKLKWLGKFNIQRHGGIVYFNSVYFGILTRKITYFPHGCLPQVDPDNFAVLQQKNYDIGIFGRIKGYKYDNVFWHQLLSFTEATGRKVIICGRGHIPIMVRQDPNIFIRNERVSDDELCDLMQKTKIILARHQYIDASGIIVKCIENTVMFLSTRVGGNTNFFRFKSHFVDLNENIFDRAEFIVQNYALFEQEFARDCKIYHSLFNYKKLGISFLHKVNSPKGDSR